MKKLATIAAFLLLFSGSVFAQPVINSVTGTIEDDGAIVILGSGFEEKAQPGPVKFDDFEGGTLGALITGVTDWLPSGTSFPTSRYTNLWSHSGSTGAGEGGLLYYTTPITGSQKMYLSWWYVIYGTEVEYGDYKGPRIGATVEAGGVGGSPTYYNGDGSHNCGWNQWAIAGVPHFATGVYEVDPGKFVILPCGSDAPATYWYEPATLVHSINRAATQEFYLKVSDVDAANGVVYNSSVDGTHRNFSNITNAPNKVSGCGDYLLNSWYVDNSVSGTNSGTWSDKLAYDDVYLDTTPQRVMIADGSTYETSDYRDIQIATSWNNGQINIDSARILSYFSPGDTAYIYVFDSDNNASNGYPVVVGEFIPPDENPYIFSIAGNDTLTITGTNFKTGPTVIVFDDFENGTNGETIPLDNATYGSWGQTATNGSLYYDNTNVTSGNLSMRVDPSPAGNTALISSFGSGYYEVFISYNEMCAGTAWPNSGTVTNWKSVWLWGDSDWGATAHRGGSVDFTIPTFSCTCSDATTPGCYIGGNDNAFVYAAGGPAPGAPWATADWALNEWRHNAIYLNQSQTDSLGVLKFWSMREGGTWTQTIDYNNELGWPEEPFYKVAFNGYTYYNVNSHPTFDDIYVAVGTGTNASARVEMGDNQDYYSCTKRDILVPVSWEDGSIKCLARENNFTTGDTCYVFVTDGLGNTTAGEVYVVGTGSLTTGVGDPTLVVNGSTLTASWVAPTESTPDYYVLYIKEDGVERRIAIMSGESMAGITITEGSTITAWVVAYGSGGVEQSRSSVVSP